MSHIEAELRHGHNLSPELLADFIKFRILSYKEIDMEIKALDKVSIDSN